MVLVILCILIGVMLYFLGIATGILYMARYSDKMRQQALEKFDAEAQEIIAKYQEKEL